jgi:hypothetical protein
MEFTAVQSDRRYRRFGGSWCLRLEGREMKENLIIRLLSLIEGTDVSEAPGVSVFKVER